VITFSPPIIIKEKGEVFVFSSIKDIHHICKLYMQLKNRREVKAWYGFDDAFSRITEIARRTFEGDDDENKDG